MPSVDVPLNSHVELLLHLPQDALPSFSVNAYTTAFANLLNIPESSVELDGTSTPYRPFSVTFDVKFTSQNAQTLSSLENVDLDLAIAHAAGVNQENVTTVHYLTLFDLVLPGETQESVHEKENKYRTAIADSLSISAQQVETASLEECDGQVANRRRLVPSDMLPSCRVTLKTRVSSISISGAQNLEARMTDSSCQSGSGVKGKGACFTTMFLDSLAEGRRRLTEAEGSELTQVEFDSTTVGFAIEVETRFRTISPLLAFHDLLKGNTNLLDPRLSKLGAWVDTTTTDTSLPVLIRSWSIESATEISNTITNSLPCGVDRDSPGCSAAAVNMEHALVGLGIVADLQVSRVIHMVTPTAMPTTAPTAAPTAVPTPIHPLPAINVIGGNVITIEASKTETFEDPGAVCNSGFGNGETFPVTSTPASHVVREDPRKEPYRLNYSCTNEIGGADFATRLVFVRDTICPVCMISGPHNLTVEAGFPFEPAGLAHCRDAFDQDLRTQIRGAVDVQQVGTYDITFWTTDYSGNADTDCAALATVLTVHVVDTLKPVIALRSRGGRLSIAHPEPETSDVTGQVNPAHDHLASKITELLSPMFSHRRLAEEEVNAAPHGAIGLWVGGVVAAVLLALRSSKGLERGAGVGGESV
jgi:hypothetical protein